MIKFTFCVSHVLIYVLSFLVLYLTPGVHSITPDDEIHLTNFNESFYLANETFVFQLNPAYMVPRSILRHTIYTSSTSALQSALKRAIMSSEAESIVLSEEDHNFVQEYLNGDIPVSIKVDKKKRSLPTSEGGLRIIPLTSKATLISSGEGSYSKKRDTTPQFGTALCLHIPFFTTCDNSQDLQAVKDALNASVEAIWQELDDYKQTNDARLKALGVALTQQKNIIAQLAAQQEILDNLIGFVAQGVQVNAATIMDGDYQIHSQTCYLKRVTNSLLKFANSLASTDPRAVTAQPSISKLFQGYFSAMQNLSTIGYQAIVDTTSATAFTWQEILLPSESVSNYTDPACLTLSTPCTNSENAMSINNASIGFTAVFSYSCNASFGYPSTTACKAQALTVESAANWIYGPFHKNHYGIYSLNVAMNATYNAPVKVIRPIVQPKTGNSVARTVSAGAPAYCVNFLGFKLFSSVYDPSTTMVNSYAPPLPASTDCDALRLYQGPADPTGQLPAKLYSMYGEDEGIVIPFYSNCDLPTITTGIFASNPSYSLLSTFNYVCSNAWTLSQTTTLTSKCLSAGGTIPEYVANADVFSRHWLTSTCYINIDPAWLELDYYVNPPLLTISNIPRGYQLNQFTINLDGELASSLEFVYTDAWVQVYEINRISSNKLLTDEISLLDGSLVVFYMDQNTVVDESDSMYGAGNNGRDCIQQSDQYDYNLLNCYFQNNNPSYVPNLYLSGSITTSGIARYNDKFTFSMNMDTEITFSLVPKPDNDFSYYIQTDGFVCPKLLNQITKSSGCLVSLFYMDSTKVVTLAPDSTSLQPISTVFSSNNTKNFTIGLGTWTVLVANQLNPGLECFILDCRYTLEFNVVQVSTPNVEIISNSDKLLTAKVYETSEATMASTVSSMENVIAQVGQLNDNINSIQDQLNSLNFDVVDLYPYENFTQLRNDVEALIANIPTGGSDSTQDCSGPWNSVQCWFKDFLSVLICLGIVIVILVIGYCVCVRMGVWKKVVGKKGHAQYEPEYRAD